MSPPQQTPPEVKARGKKLFIHFVDSLQDSTTYTLDFGNAVCDFREKNPLPGYQFAFSTGPVIDTLEIGGYVYDASNLNPVQGVMVGIHSNLSDTAFTTKPFARVARTDSVGAFRITNMKDGHYRLYAVDDISRDYRMSPGEAIAFADSLFTPFVHPHIHTDSLGNDSLVGYEYGPADLQLWFFTLQQQRLYMQRTQRDKQHLIQLTFSAAPDSVPTYRVLNPTILDTLPNDTTPWIDPTPYIAAKYSAKADTLSLWLTDSIAIAQDTIALEITYRRTDSLYRLEWGIDTVRAVWRAPRLTEKAKAALDKQNRNRKLELKSNARKSFEIYDTLRIHSVFPVDSVDSDKIRLVQQVDTTKRILSYELIACDSLRQTLVLLTKLEPEQSYVLTIDSAAMYDIYGKCNDSIDYKLKLKSLDEYSTLLVRMTHFDARARIQLLNDQDKVLRELPAKTEGSKFEYLTPTTYYMRMYIDYNGDGKWTTGDWMKKRQPEPVYYFPSKLKLRANWDFEENFDHLATPQTSSKPRALVGKSTKH
jgi:hypothetical protein